MAAGLQTVAVDGFGVEAGFGVLAGGVARAAADGIPIRVFGPADELASPLSGVPGVELVETSEAITNRDDPVPAVRSRSQASIVRAVADVAEGNSAAVVSLGSTGAAMAASTFGLRRIRGIKRPALAVQVPLPGGNIIFLDVGANVETRASHLVQFACLGAAFHRVALDPGRPSVGLLSVGEERGKGRPVDVEAFGMLEDVVSRDDFDGFEFVGNVEGSDIPAGEVDVIVTDGFTGNVALKAMEGAVSTVTGAIRDAARSNPLSAAGGLLLKPALGSLRRDLDPDSTGGAILLGLRSPSIVGHGGSGEEGVANAIRMAHRSAVGDMPGRTASMLEAAGLDLRSIRGAAGSPGSGDGS